MAKKLHKVYLIGYTCNVCYTLYHVPAGHLKSLIREERLPCTHRSLSLSFVGVRISNSGKVDNSHPVHKKLCRRFNKIADERHKHWIARWERKWGG